MTQQEYSRKVQERYPGVLLDEARDGQLAERFVDVVRMMAALRRQGGCPWDAKQTPESLLTYVLEEAYEVADAVLQKDWDALRDELGDYLLQVLFQAEIQHQEGRFDVLDVLEGLLEKMVRRHPHVFLQGNGGESEEDIKTNWERIKRQEKQTNSLFAAFPQPMSALLEACKIGRKAAKIGFDWATPAEVLDKVQEELDEARAALASKDEAHLVEELGDLLFSVAQAVRLSGHEGEIVLRRANLKFIRRFQALEAKAQSEGLDPLSLDQASLERLWQAVKLDEKEV